MKRIFIGGVFILFVNVVHAQNVGIGVPVPLQKLDVNGAIKIGTTATNQPGAIRFNAGKFEGGNGASWLPMEGLPQTSIILSETETNTTLTNAGYTIVGKTQFNYNGFGATGTWVPIPLLDLVNVTGVNAISFASGIWAGGKYIVWGGLYGGTGAAANGIKNFGYLFNPTTNLWTNASTTGAPVARNKHFSARAANNKMLIFGGLATSSGGGNLPYNDGAIYDPATDTWGPVFSTVNAPNAYALLTGVKALDTVANKLYTFSWYLGVAYAKVYNIGTATWSNISITNCPPVNLGLSFSAVWMGAPVNKWIVMGGDLNNGTVDVRIFNPATGTWQIMATPPAFVEATETPTLLWTGSEVIVYSGRLSGTDNWSAQAVKYNPLTNVWTNLATANKPGPRMAFSAFYGSNKVFIWGGMEKKMDNSIVKLNSGAYYDLSLNTWNEIPVTSSTPDLRASALVEWNGQELYIWAGSSESGRTGALSGGRYNPDIPGSPSYGGLQSKTYYLFKKQ
jgi:N-acetylneuraminic acid mutarotase